VPLRSKITAYLLFFVYKILQWTWKIEVHESEGLKKLLSEDKLFVAGHWHGEELGIIYLLKRYKVGCMVSMSSDGDLMAKVVELFGSRAARGSSSRGAVQALKGLLRLTKEGWRPSVAVDGPRGPRHVVKPGIVEIAKVLKLPIVTISMACSKPFVFKKSWNKSELPLPFSKIVVTWSDLIWLDEKNDLEAHLPLVAASLHECRKKSLAQLKNS
jgi:lysophospholipid acyltransferase (LPLAT)-like uncharacterized protein